MNFLRKAVACALLLCAGLQQVVADDQLTKEDSVALEKLYHDYYSAMYKATVKTSSQMDELRRSAVRDRQKEMEIENLYYQEMQALRKGFGDSLAANPRFATIARLRNLFLNYREEKNAASEAMYKELIEYYEEDVFFDLYNDYQVDFVYTWNDKFITLIQENPSFITYPEYLFNEYYDDIQVTTSADGRLRSYRWSNLLLKNCPEFTSFQQYRTDDGKVLVNRGEELNDDNLVKNIHVLEADGIRIYLLEMYAKLGNDRSICHYYAEAIEGDDITHPHVFEGKNENEDFGVVYDEKLWPIHVFQDDDWVMKYDEATRTIFVREYEDESKGILSDKYKSYVFDGEVFKLSD